jgi:hypothetical protein
MAVIGMLGLLLLAGCSGPKRGGGPKSEQTAAVQSDLKLLEPFLLKEKPQAEQSVLDVRDKAKNGDEVVFHGVVPPANVKPWSDTLAVFKLMAKEDLEDPKVKDEFACEEAET